MAEEEGEALFMIMPDERQTDFKLRLSQLMVEFQELGPVIQCCLISQVMGHTVFLHLNGKIPQMEKNINLNYHHGIDCAMGMMMEQSATETKN